MDDTSNKDFVLEKAKKKKNTFDQMASMHFKLSDRYKCYSVIEDSFEMLASVFLCGVTFLDFEKYFHFTVTNTDLIIGFVSIFIFALTLIKQRLGHKQLSEQHHFAGKMLTKSKLDIDNKICEWSTSKDIKCEEICSYLNYHYENLNDLPQIPEKNFLKLKHTHQQKVEFSKFLDKHKNEPMIVCKLKFYLNCKKSKVENSINEK